MIRKLKSFCERKRGIFLGVFGLFPIALSLDLSLRQKSYADRQWIERIYLLLLSSFVEVRVWRLRVAKFQVNGRVAELVEGT